MLTRSWNVLDRGAVPEEASQVPFTCPGCGQEARLPVAGRVLAQTAEGLVFDEASHAAPRLIECRRCRRRYQMEA